METAIYVRVSTEEQVQEGFSIRAQEQKLKDFTRIKEWPIFNIYMDEGLSGKNITERPAVSQMIQDIKKGNVKNVLVFKIDRLTRSTSDLIYLVDLFNRYDCAFNSLMESIDTRTASGRMFLKIIGVFAEFERENIIERVKTGRERKVREGYTLCSSHASYGYDRANGQRIQSVNTNEAQIVREIFDMYVNRNMPLNSIARAFNMRKVPTKKNTAWQRKNIKNILRNSNYVGRVRHFIDDKEKYTENDGLHEAIISEELFNEAQKLLERTPKVSSTKKPKDCNYYLGILVCGKCGVKLGSHGRNKILPDGTQVYVGAYRCRDGFTGCCNSGDMGHKKVEDAFVNYISSVADFDVDIEIKEADNIKTDAFKLMNDYNKRLSELAAKEKEIMALYVDNEIGFGNYKSMSQKIIKDREFINSELEKVNTNSDEGQPIKKEDIILSLHENWSLLTDIEKRQFLLRFVNRIVVTGAKINSTRTNTAIIEEVEFNKGVCI
ncbi:MAG: recombinase family protein [Oscillospiraceae bacterium]|nr:recombinase family protein [Oscillospiraceae bacterium]